MSGFRGMLVDDTAVPAGAKFGVAKGMHNLPQGAIQLSKEQMESILAKTIDNWVPPKDVYSLKYGNFLQAAMASASGYLFNDLYRTSFKLGNRHKLVSFAPSVAIPSICAFLLQHFYVTNPLVMGEIDCPVCAETRSLSIQIGAGFIQPMLLGFMASAVIAKNEYTAEVPPLTDYKKVAEQFRKVSRPFLPHMMMLLGFNVFAASYVTYTQGRCALQVRERIFGPVSTEELPDS